VAGYNHLLKRRLAVCCSCRKSTAKSPALVAVFCGPLKIAKLALPKRMHPLFRLVYQVEIRHYQNPSSKIPHQKSLIKNPSSKIPHQKSLIKNPWPAHKCYTRQYNEIVAIAGLVT
jgi:hypothetical protein